MAAPANRRDFLLSIRPEYADLIVQGEKTVELRRRFPENVHKDAVALIYCTSPTKAIIGAAAILEVKRLSVAQLWREHGTDARIERKAFVEYFAGRDEGFAILLSQATKFHKQLSASNLKKRFGFIAPQSFVYLPNKYYSLLENDRLQVLN